MTYRSLDPQGDCHLDSFHDRLSALFSSAIEMTAQMHIPEEAVEEVKAPGQSVNRARLLLATAQTICTNAENAAELKLRNALAEYTDAVVCDRYVAKLVADLDRLCPAQSAPPSMPDAKATLLTHVPLLVEESLSLLDEESHSDEDDDDVSMTLETTTATEVVARPTAPSNY